MRYHLDDNLSNYFDRFVTGFILFNCLYNELNKFLCLELKADNKKAVVVARVFLNSKTIQDETIIFSKGNEILRMIMAKEFHIWNKDTDHQHPAVIQLASSKSEEWVTGLLKIIYGIRCNMFHGEKDFSGNQIKILTPCILVIEKLNEMIIEKLKTTG